jgi:hypothetical protein
MATFAGLPQLKPPGYAQGAAQQPMQRPMIQPMLRPDALRPPQGGPGTVAPPSLATRMQPTGGGERPAFPRLGGVGPNIHPRAPEQPKPFIGLRPPVTTPAQGQMAGPAITPPAPRPPQIQPPVAGSPYGPNAAGVPLGQVGGLIQQQLANPTRFDLPAFKDIFNFAKGDLQAEADRSRQGVTADAARRGVFHSDVPDTMTGGMHDINERYNRGLGALSSNLALEAARTGGQDFNSSLGNAFRFMENQQGADQFAANLGLQSAGLGYGGSPDINQLLSQISGQPLPQLGQNPLEALGSSLAMFQRPGATAPTVAPPVAGSTPALPQLPQLPQPKLPAPQRPWARF